MKLTYIFVIAGLLLTAQAASACDESCKREQAQAKLETEFPGYLTWKYCDGLKHDFMTVDMNSLQSYSSKHFNTKYKGPIKNIIKLIDQREEWLKECDSYLSATREDRIFYDEKTTASVFSQMTNIRKELQAVLEGVRYSSFQGDETKEIVGEKFETLFVVIDNHKNLMHLKGKYVYK